MKKYILLLFFVFTAITSTKLMAQTADSTKAPTGEQVMPEFPGGEEALNAYLDKTMIYPKEAKKKNIQGRVWACFIVDAEGNISHVEILRGIGGGCDEEVIRVIEKMPKWKPGTLDGKPVIVKFRFPINFTLK